MRSTRRPKARITRALAGLAVLAVMGTLLTACGFEITTTSLPDAAQGRAYVGQLEAGGGKEPYTWTVTAGTLPSGLSLNATTGRITGTPTVLGTRTFTVKATGTDDKSVSQELSIEVVVGNRWTQTDRDGGRRAWAGDETSITPANVGGLHQEWMLPTGIGPAVVAGGVAYAVGQLPGTTDAALMAIDVVTSDVLWSAPLAGGCSAGVVALVGTTVVTGCGTVVEGHAASGGHERLWSTAETDPSDSTVVDILVSGSTVVVNRYDRVTAYDPSTGERQWQQLAPAGYAIAGYAAGSNRVVVAFSDRVKAIALDTGSVAWEKPITAGGRVAIADGWVYLAVDGKMTRFKTDDGAPGWTSPVDPDGHAAEGAFSIDGKTVYTYWATYNFGFDSYALRALNTTDGSQRWRIVLPIRLQSLARVGDLLYATLSAGGFYGGQNAQLDVLSPLDGSTLKSVPHDHRFNPGTAIANGRALVLGWDGLHTYGLAPARPVPTVQVLRSGRVGTAYQETLTASSGTTPYTWSVASGSLPAGVTLSAAGTLSGTPTAAGSATVRFRVTDSRGATAQVTRTIQIKPAAGTSAWSVTRGSSARNGTNVDETLVSLDRAPQIAARWRTAATPLANPSGGVIDGLEPVSDGTRLYATGRDGSLRAWSATGTVTNRTPLWTATADAGPAGPEWFTSPPTESGGTLYVKGSDGAVYAVRASDGARLWREPITADVTQEWTKRSAPVVAGGRVLLVDARSEPNEVQVRALSASTGDPVWASPAVVADRALPDEPPALSTDGTRLYVQHGCRLIAINVADGTDAWRTDTGPEGASCSTLRTGPPPVANGTVFATGEYTAAFDAATGAVQWRTRRFTVLGGAVANGLFITAEATGEFTQAPIALDARTGAVLWSNAANSTLDGASVSGDLVLIRTGTSVAGLDIQNGETVFDSGPLTGQFDYRSGGVAVAGGRLFVDAPDGTIRAYGPP